MCKGEATENVNEKSFQSAGIFFCCQAEIVGKNCGKLSL